MVIHSPASRAARRASGTRCVHSMLAAVMVLSLLIGGCAASVPANPAQPAVPPPATPLPPTPFVRDPIENMAAFARLLGYIHYFHPSDAVAATNWDDFAILNIESVADAAGPADLANRLGALFGPYAPTVRIFASSSEPPIADPALALPAAAAPISVTMWVRSPYRNGPNQRGDVRPALRIALPVVDGHLPTTATLSLSDLLFSYNNQGEIDGGPNDPRITITVSAPADVTRVELGGGVSALVPLTLFADAGGTLPHRPAPAPSSAAKTTRGRHLGAVAGAWNMFQHFFPYWDSVSVDWGQSLRDGLRMAATTDDEQAFMTGLREMMAVTADGHLFLSHPENTYNRPQDNPWAALGPGALPFRWDMVEDAFVVTSVTTGANSLKPGDRIVAINGVASQDAIADQTRSIGPKTGYGTWQALYNMRRGSVASKVTLAIQPLDGAATYTTTLTRSEDLSPPMNSLPAVASLGQGVVYVNVRFLTADTLAESVPLLAQATGIVIDSRDYPKDFMTMIRLYGHLTDAPLHTAPLLNLVVTRPDTPTAQLLDMSQTYTFIEPLAPRFTGKVAFIIGGAAVSQSEHFLGVAEHYGLGDLVGEPTAGTNGNIVLQTLPGGYAISWTGMRVTKFDGSPLFGVGVLPTIPAHRTIAGVASGRDELLERAFEVVSGQPATAMKVDPAIKR
jgi:C-terminal processing protease CtpA/Prc